MICALPVEGPNDAVTKLAHMPLMGGGDIREGKKGLMNKNPPPLVGLPASGGRG